MMKQLHNDCESDCKYNAFPPHPQLYNSITAESAKVTIMPQAIIPLRVKRNLSEFVDCLLFPLVDHVKVFLRHLDARVSEK